MILTVWRCDVCGNRQETEGTPENFAVDGDNYGDVCPSCKAEFQKLVDDKAEAMQVLTNKWDAAKKEPESSRPEIFRQPEVTDGGTERPGPTQRTG